MALDRVSTLNLQQITLSNALRVQNNIFNEQEQISSGVKTNNFEGLAGQVELFTGLENQLSKTGQYLQNNQLVNNTLNSTGTALGQIASTGNSLKNLLLQRRNGAVAGTLNFPQQLQDIFQAIASQLNTNVNGQYIFSGTSTNTQPVATTNLPTSIVTGVPDASYYQGNTQDITARVQDGVQITSNIRADSKGFQEIMAGIATAKTADAQNSDQLLQQAYNLVQQGVNDVLTLQGQVGATQATLQNANNFLNTQKTYLQSLHDDTINADVVSLSTKLAVDQTTLQATFQAFARINSLQLSSFLPNA